MRGGAVMVGGHDLDEDPIKETEKEQSYREEENQERTTLQKPPKE